MPQVQTLKLSDGRTLGWYEYGDPSGLPLLHTTGTPADGSAAAIWDTTAKEMGIRVVSFDKPGYGVSTVVRNRKLRDWAKDVSAVADHLGIERFAVSGESGGGPHVLALAHEIPQRITVAINLAGMGPADTPGVTDGMKKTNVRLFTLARIAPWALRIPLGAMGKALNNPAKAEKYIAKQMKEAPAADKQLFAENPQFMPLMLAATAGAFKNGPDGAIEEMKMFSKPWGFRIEDITAPVVLFHGEQDVNVPIGIARDIVSKLQHCDARIYPEQGHSVALPKLKDVLQCVLDAA